MRHNLDLMEYMVNIHQHLDISTVEPSAKAQSELNLVMEDKIFKRIVGSIHIDMLKRRY